MVVIAGVEIGGTSVSLALCEDEPNNIIERGSVPTEDPESTLQGAVQWLEERRGQFQAIGIGCFGPVDLNPASSTYGFVTTSPKPGWQHQDVVGRFRHFQVPIAFETDVNAPAVFEAHSGGFGSSDTVCYVTVGTGIGVGISIGGKAVHGYRHPEAGHLPVRPHQLDVKSNFEGVCPYHGTCLEGMAASRSIAARKGIDRRELQSISDDDQVWDIVGYYLGMLCFSLQLTVSPSAIIFGGGILQRKGLLEKVRGSFVSAINKYVEHPPIDELIRAASHPNAGLVATLHLGFEAFSLRSSSYV